MTAGTMRGRVPGGPRLLSVGNVVIDITLRVPALPERGGDVLADSSGMAAGGSFNTMLAAVRQGLPAAYGGAHGSGPFGELARAALRQAGIGILLLPVPEADTGYDIAITDAGGERTFVTVVGAEGRLTRERLGPIAVASGDLVHVSGYGLLHEANRDAIVNWLPGLPADTVVLLDPGPLGHEIPADALRAVLGRADWWSGNLAEATGATGAADALEAARRLAVRPGCGVIVRLGAEGCVVLAPGADPVRVPGFPVEPVDSNGAGDTHVGAFLAALATGADPLTAARRANACAALAVTRPGPATSPARAEVDALLASGR